MQDLFRKESMKLLNYEIGGTKPLLLIADPAWLNLNNCRLIQLDF